MLQDFFDVSSFTTDESDRERCRHSTA